MAEPKTPPKAMPKTPPKAAIKVAPGKPQIKAVPKKGRGKQAGDRLDQHLEPLGVGSGAAQAPTSRKGGQAFLGRAPDAADNGQVPRDGAANLLLSVWT